MRLRSNAAKAAVAVSALVLMGFATTYSKVEVRPTEEECKVMAAIGALAPAPYRVEDVGVAGIQWPGPIEPRLYKEFRYNENVFPHDENWVIHPYRVDCDWAALGAPNLRNIHYPDSDRGWVQPLWNKTHTVAFVRYMSGSIAEARNGMGSQCLVRPDGDRFKAVCVRIGADTPPHVEE
jgi:hypothetical protein